MQDFDYIIVGAGSAGCVLADKLSASGNIKFCCWRQAPLTGDYGWVPIGYGISCHDAQVNWKYQSEPNPGINGRKMYFPRGKVVGGSSSINALIYHRGQANDYDDWATAGNPGWDYKAVSKIYDSFEQVSKVGAEGDILPTYPCLSVTDATASYHP